MAKLLVTDFFIYRWRYVIGYGVVVIALAALLIIAGLYIPGGLSDAERDSVVQASQINPLSLDSLGVINAPYLLLQQLSLWLFGVSTFAIKLPSLILGFASAIGMFFLLRRWFRNNVAVIASAITITTGQFLFISQQGTPAITYIFWSVFILLAAMSLVRKSKFRGVWTFVFFALAVLSLYTPLSIYILLAIGSAAVLHPHLRYIVRQLSKVRMTIIATLSLALVAPLGYGVYRDPELGLRLLGIPSEMPNLITNASTFSSQHLDFLSPSSGTIMTPIFGFGSVAIIILGILHLIRSHHTARSYIISVWLLLLLPILLINPEFITITFLPLLLLLATGFDTLIREWYRLFPKNPYARIAGLLPLTILVGGLFLSGIERYAYGYQYDPRTVTNFSRDLRLIDRELDQHRGDVVLVTSDKERDFFSVFANNPKSYNQDVTLRVATETPDGNDIQDTIIFSRHARQNSSPERTPNKIIVAASKDAADRFYVYKNESN